MITRRNRTLLALILLTAFLAASYFAYTASAENPSAGKTKKAVEAADAATKKAQAASGAAFDAAIAASGTKYPDNEDGRAAAAADEDADTADQAATDALKAAAAARKKACESGKPEDAKAADEAEKAAQEAEKSAAEADAAADKADRKADPYGKQLQKKKRDARRAARAAIRQAIAAVCFALKCAQLMDESSEQNKKKKEETIETIDGLDSSVDQLLGVARRDDREKVEKGYPSTASPSTGSKPNGAKASVVTGNGLHRITYDNLHGQVVVDLTDDSRAGDTISGTVLAKPNGNTAEERKANEAKLSELKLNFGSRFPQDKKELMIFITPRVIIQDEESSGASSSNPTNFTTKLPDTFDYTIGVNAPRTDTQTVTITINSPIWFINNQPLTPPRTEPPLIPDDFQFPSMGQKGRPIEILGPFDGNSSNTTLRFGPAGSTLQDFEKNTENVSGGFGLIKPLAESPRKLVCEAPSNVTGPIALNLKEGDMQTIGAYRNVGLRLTAKTTLMKGESTTLNIEVSGLQRIDKPVPFTLQANGPITVERGMNQSLVIQPSQVSADGRYTTTRGIQGVQAGAWEATVIVVTPPPYFVLLGASPPQHLIINSRTGHYVFCRVGEKFSGTGQVKTDGCTFHFFQDSNERLLMGVLSACKPSDDRYWVFASGLQTVDFRLTVTSADPPRTRVYFNQLNRPFPPVQDVSAFATCP